MADGTDLRVASRHGVWSLTIALRMVRSFRAMAMNATLGGLPAATSRWYMGLRTGLKREAFIAAR